jgi:hypothetical protein
MHVLQGRIIEILGGGDECAKEDTLECPLLECDVKMRFCPIDVDKSGEYDWCGDLGTVYDVGDEGGERGILDMVL